MSAVATQNITQHFLGELSAHSMKASFTPLNKIASALKHLEEKGIPNNKVEDYKYCSIEAMIRKDFKSLSASFSSADQNELKKLRKDKNAVYIFILNGKISEELSDLKNLPNGIAILNIEDASNKHIEAFQKHYGNYAKEDNDALIALNTAFADKGIFVSIKKSAAIEKPVHFIYADSASGNVAINFRKLFVIEENAQFTFSESFITPNHSGKLFSNHVSEIHVDTNAAVNHTIIQEGNTNFYGVNTVQVDQQNQSNYSINTFTFGGLLVRNNLNIVVNGEHAETHLNGLCLTNENQLVDNHTVVDHARANCESNELYKGIASGKSTLVFNGKIFVRRDSQKINAYQSSKNILLSDEATVDTKPQLEIFANDVKCSHGTSTGKVDEEALFYLKSRGIGNEQARKLLLRAFAGEVIEKVKNEHLRNEIEEKFENVLSF